VNWFLLHTKKPLPFKGGVVHARVEIISPGHLPNNLTVANILTGNSNIRNPIFASFAAKLLPYRGLGTGILRIPCANILRSNLRATETAICFAPSSGLTLVEHSAEETGASRVALEPPENITARGVSHTTGACHWHGGDAPGHQWNETQQMHRDSSWHGQPRRSNCESFSIPIQSKTKNRGKVRP
jgi:hypothetical protein